MRVWFDLPTTVGADAFTPHFHFPDLSRPPEPFAKHLLSRPKQLLRQPNLALGVSSTLSPTALETRRQSNYPNITDYHSFSVPTINYFLIQVA